MPPSARSHTAGGAYSLVAEAQPTATPQLKLRPGRTTFRRLIEAQNWKGANIVMPAANTSIAASTGTDFGWERFPREKGGACDLDRLDDVTMREMWDDDVRCRIGV